MKQLLILLTIAFCGAGASAQETNTKPSVPAEDRAQVSDSNQNLELSEAASYTGNTQEKKFEVNRERIVYRRTFKVTNANTANEVFERAKNFARVTNVNFKENKSKKTLTIPVDWRYHGGYNECVEDMNLKGDLLVEIKGTKTRISLTNITYEHKDRGNGEAKGVAKSNLLKRQEDCAPQSGKVELIYNCTSCNESLQSVTRALQSQFDIYADQYQDALRWY